MLKCLARILGTARLETTGKLRAKQGLPQKMSNGGDDIGVESKYFFDHDTRLFMSEMSLTEGMDSAVFLGMIM